MVAYVDPAAGRGEDGRRRAPLHVGVLEADHSPGPSSTAARCSSTRIASSPSAPENSARCGSWSRASGATDSQASSGMYGGLQVTTSTVPARSSNAVGHVALAQVDPGAGEVAHRPTVRRLVELDRVHASAAGTSSAIALATAPDPVHRSTTTGAPSAHRRHCSIAQPASSSVSGRGTKTPGPTASSTWRKYAVPVRCCSGSRAARRATSASYSSSAEDATSSTSTSRDRVVPSTCDEQLGSVVVGAGHPGGPQHARWRPAGAVATTDHCSSASSRVARSASMQESRTGWRSPSSTWSRL